MNDIISNWNSSSNICNYPQQRSLFILPSLISYI